MEKKVARDVMKPLAEAKMKSLDSRMDFHSWTEISDWGYSRIPIYKPLGNDQGTDTTYSDFNIKIIGFLHAFVSLDPRLLTYPLPRLIFLCTQDLIFVIIDEITTLKQLPLHKLPVISEDYPLWDLLRLFQVCSFLAILLRWNPQTNFE